MQGMCIDQRELLSENSLEKHKNKKGKGVASFATITPAEKLSVPAESDSAEAVEEILYIESFVAFQTFPPAFGVN